VSSAALLADRLPDGVLHQFVPVDLPTPARRFLDHWRPDLALWLESELWPTLLRQSARRGVMLILVNGRMSAASHRRWRWARPVARALLSGFRLLLAQGGDDAARLQDLSGRAVRCPGNLKLAAAVLPCDAALLAHLAARRGARPIWLAASTHEGEEAIAGAVHRTLAPHHPGLLTVIVPRHPARGAAIRDGLGAIGLAAGRRAEGADLPLAEGIYVADTMGELGNWYRLADLVFIGGTLVPHGGQNPLEPARLGCAVLHGPHIFNFAEIAAGLTQAGAARPVADTASLIAAVEGLLSDATARHAMAAAGQRFAAAQGEIIERVASELAPFLGQMLKPLP
jgi:3-deoxy-D-manno-octulosonic-acid transferase